MQNEFWLHAVAVCVAATGLVRILANIASGMVIASTWSHLHMGQLKCGTSSTGIGLADDWPTMRQKSTQARNEYTREYWVNYLLVIVDSTVIWPLKEYHIWTKAVIVPPFRFYGFAELMKPGESVIYCVWVDLLENVLLRHHARKRSHLIVLVILYWLTSFPGISHDHKNRAIMEESVTSWLHEFTAFGLERLDGDLLITADWTRLHYLWNVTNTRIRSVLTADKSGKPKYPSCFFNFVHLE